MTLNQVSVFISNKTGRMSAIIDVLARNRINIRALSMADTTDYGVLRLIVDNPDLAEKALVTEGFTVSLTKVIGIQINDAPGGLAVPVKMLTDHGIGIDYMYAFTGTVSGHAYVVFRVEDPDNTAVILQKHGFSLLDSSAIAARE